MSVNTLNFEQIGIVLTDIVQQATGRAVSAPVSTSDFTSIAQVALRADRDSVMNAISNVLARTIFSIRPYSAKLTGLMMDTFRWGAMMRKLSIVDSSFKDDPAFEWPALYDATQNPPTGNGQSIDPWAINKPDVLQTNFYGQSVYFDEMTIFEDQLETAFTGPEQLGSFLSLIMTNLSNRLELSTEGLRRGLVANAIGAIVDENQPDRVVHLLAEYNQATGQSYTAQSIYEPDNFSGFMKWVYSRVAQISDLMTEMSLKYQTVISGKPVLRHTPQQDQRIYLFSPTRHDIDARVLADTFHDSYLKYADVESVNFWQSINSPDSINVTPAYTDTNGVLKVPASPVTQGDIFGIMFDRDAMGMTLLDKRVLSTPLNTKGLYRNLHVHCRQRVVFDNTEKVVVLLLD